MKFCPVCNREFPDNVKFCPNDGQTLRSKSASADLVGQVVANNYHILKKLGEGGMGAVYLGEHVKMGRKSAIKVMASAMAQDPDAISRFNREAGNAAKISHPNVCQVYDFGETPDGLIYLVMEFIEGESLKDLVEREGAIDPVRAASILRQSADALQAAHDLGIVHRDIKPDNIMLMKGRDGSDVVKVVDFGIARAVGGDDAGQKVTKTGLVVGTPEYMSPEQLAGDKLDGRSDIYSLALVLYRMLTGTLPFQADSAQEVMIKRLTDDPLPLDQARPDLTFPPKLQIVMNNALARTAAERYQQAAEFGRDTADAVSGMGPPATRVGIAPPQGATQVMSNEEVAQATKHQAAQKAPPGKRPTTPAPAPPPAPAAGKKFPLVPVLGGVGGVGVMAVVAFLMMTKGTPTTGADSSATPDTAKQLVSAPPDSGQTSQQNRPVPGNTSSNVPAPRPGPGTTQTQTQPTPGTPTPAVTNWADTLTAANAAFDNDDYASTRRMATAVYNAPVPPDLKASAAVLMASSFGAVGNTERAVEWWCRVRTIATGDRLRRAEDAIQTLGGGQCPAR